MRIPEGELKSGLHEIKEHGGKGFPFNIYPCSIPVDFPRVQVHWHEEMEIVSIRRGLGAVTVDKETVQAGPGEAVAVFPGQLHGISRLGEEVMEYENIIFRPEMLMSGAGDICTLEFLMPMAGGGARRPVHMRPGLPGYEAFDGCLRTLDGLCAQRPYGYQMGVKGALFGMLGALLQVWVPGEGARPGRSRERIKRLLEYVEAHYGERITVEQAAGLCFYSSSHFMKYFKQYMGLSFVEYLNGYRLFKAAGALLQGTERVTDIAQGCGFENVSYFNRLFRQRYGCTPREYRTAGRGPADGGNGA